ncbi:MAG: hypothetical protein JWN00_2347 [Actinomycetia bacterium]|nr:hypothetical protein [Actinomycetes bacterium]
MDENDRRELKFVTTKVMVSGLVAVFAAMSYLGDAPLLVALPLTIAAVTLLPHSLWDYWRVRRVLKRAR